MNEKYDCEKNDSTTFYRTKVHHKLYASVCRVTTKLRILKIRIMHAQVIEASSATQAYRISTIS